MELIVERLGDAIELAIHEFDDVASEDIKKMRREKFLTMGRVGLSS